MGRPCSICRHSDRVSIETEARSSTVRGVARAWGVGESSLRRHLSTHLPEPDQAQADIVVSKVHEGLERMEALESRLAQVLSQAQSSGDLRTAMAAVSGFTRVRAELRANLSFLTRLRDTEERNAVRQELASPVWIQIRTVIEEALAPFPKARRAVAVRLKEMLDDEG
jgi:hypothetical protein